ncbi:ASKHA domain-containing protein [Pelagicoccus sp. SDUM812005]|uniref:ASKHA domain-containing protein n=1 Tax=Pelagicoccus sp. SDUM812005 TaxID=3041257 RepID=UPI00280E8799|nr:ASKHA domain-containing protein [Pelagicoccus sp. SDUM812005]MDQ8183670.1 ASKHA domain-containing protein [Pelagicoccus sp. SDUM812005]
MHKVDIATPCTLSTHLREQRIPLKMSCGGHGSCKTCRVILDGQPVLACQTEVEAGSYDITVPESAASSANISIDLSTIEDGLICESPRWTCESVTVPPSEEHPNRSNRQRIESALPQGLTLAPHFFDGTTSSDFEGPVELACFDGQAQCIAKGENRKCYALAVDIGTTTLAATLIDLEKRELVDSRGRLNGQYAYSEDLVARIAFCHTPELLAEMQELGLKRSLAPLLKSLLRDNGVSSDQVLNTVLSGNSPMIHILLGLDPTGMGGWPFNGVDFAPSPRPAADYRLPGRQLEFVPSQSAYLGGDIISGLTLLDFESLPDNTLFVDLGTNAEMAFKSEGRLLCTAVPAGPSFEGGGFPCGVSAIPGAIDHVWEEGGELRYSTIGDQPAIGLCGSGIISFVAAAYRARILRKKGRYTRRHDKVETRELLGQSQRVYAFTEDVYLSEDDISNFLQAKAAVFSGIITMAKVAGIDVFDIVQLHLAGNFGKRVRVPDMIDIGLIPPLDPKKVSPCGNASLKGAIHYAIDRNAKHTVRSLIDKLEWVELNAQESFQNDFINALFIPHLTLEFPESRIERTRTSSERRRA